MRLKTVALAGLLLSVAVPAHAQRDPLAMFEGVWVTVTPPIRHITFYRVAGGQREAALPFGHASIRVSNGEHGSTLRVSGRGFDCYYWVGKIDSKKMTWELRSGSSVCMKSMVLEKDPP